MSLPDEKKVEAALHFLAETDEEFSHLFAAKDAHKEKLKLLRAKAYLEAEGTDGYRRAFADAHPDVEQEIEEGKDTLAEYKLLEQRRDRANTVVSVWQSLTRQQR